jgi:hypothetical protein
MQEQEKFEEILRKEGRSWRLCFEAHGKKWLQKL